MTVVLRASLTEQPILLAEHEELVAHRSAGAIVGFVGMIRDHDEGRRVVRLEYSAHPSAAQLMADVVAEVAQEAGGVRAVAASHRIGALHIGEAQLTSTAEQATPKSPVIARAMSRVSAIAISSRGVTGKTRIFPRLEKNR